MKIKLAKKHLEYLLSHLDSKKKHLIEICQNSTDNKSIGLEIQDDIGEEIRNWAMERQQKTGFDIKYNLTPEGQILEELIDLFYKVD